MVEFDVAKFALTHASKEELEICDLGIRCFGPHYKASIRI